MVEALPLRPRRHHLRPRHMAALPAAGEGRDAGVQDAEAGDGARGVERDRLLCCLA